jgi:hypothetical protein
MLVLERKNDKIGINFVQLTDQSGIIIQNIGCPVFLIDLAMSGGKAINIIEVPAILSQPNQSIFRQFP